MTNDPPKRRKLAQVAFFDRDYALEQSGDQHELQRSRDRDGARLLSVLTHALQAFYIQPTKDWLAQYWHAGLRHAGVAVRYAAAHPELSGQLRTALLAAVGAESDAARKRVAPLLELPDDAEADERVVGETLAIVHSFVRHTEQHAEALATLDQLYFRPHCRSSVTEEALRAYVAEVLPQATQVALHERLLRIGRRDFARGFRWSLALLVVFSKPGVAPPCLAPWSDLIDRAWDDEEVFLERMTDAANDPPPEPDTTADNALTALLAPTAGRGNLNDHQLRMDAAGQLLTGLGGRVGEPIDEAALDAEYEAQAADLSPERMAERARKFELTMQYLRLFTEAGRDLPQVRRTPPLELRLNRWLREMRGRQIYVLDLETQARNAGPGRPPITNIQTQRLGRQIARRVDLWADYAVTRPPLIGTAKMLRQVFRETGTCLWDQDLWEPLLAGVKQRVDAAGGSPFQRLRHIHDALDALLAGVGDRRDGAFRSFALKQIVQPYAGAFYADFYEALLSVHLQTLGRLAVRSIAELEARLCSQLGPNSYAEQTRRPARMAMDGNVYGPAEQAATIRMEDEAECEEAELYSRAACGELVGDALIAAEEAAVLAKVAEAAKAAEEAEAAEAARAAEAGEAGETTANAEDVTMVDNDDPPVDAPEDAPEDAEEDEEDEEDALMANAEDDEAPNEAVNEAANAEDAANAAEANAAAPDGAAAPAAAPAAPRYDTLDGVAFADLRVEVGPDGFRYFTPRGTEVDPMAVLRMRQPPPNARRARSNVDSPESVLAAAYAEYTTAVANSAVVTSHRFHPTPAGVFPKAGSPEAVAAQKELAALRTHLATLRRLLRLAYKFESAPTKRALEAGIPADLRGSRAAYPDVAYLRVLRLVRGLQPADTMGVEYELSQRVTELHMPLPLGRGIAGVQAVQADFNAYTGGEHAYLRTLLQQIDTGHELAPPELLELAGNTAEEAAAAQAHSHPRPPPPPMHPPLPRSTADFDPLLQIPQGLDGRPRRRRVLVLNQGSWMTTEDPFLTGDVECGWLRDRVQPVKGLMHDGSTEKQFRWLHSWSSVSCSWNGGQFTCSWAQLAMLERLLEAGEPVSAAELLGEERDKDFGHAMLRALSAESRGVVKCTEDGWYAVDTRVKPRGSWLRLDFADSYE